MKSETVEGRRWVGRVLRDRWRIDERLSRGGVGTVYAATHKNNGSRAAIKVLHPEFARDEDTRSRFLQEGYAANQVNHPGVVRILDDDTTEDGHAYLVMELLEGELLEKRRVRKGGMLPLGEVFEVGDQLLDVLAAAHDKGIVHRDIKPENLFITREGRLKVLDFGFAQMKSGFRHEQTATGFLLGTPGFMSPEQAVGNRALIDAKTDIWAAGATLFTLISGEPVHDGQSAAEMLVAAANYPPRSLATVVSGMPPRLIQLVDRAVAFDKNDRWPSARAMQAALRDIATRQSNVVRPQQYSIPDREPMSEGMWAAGESVQTLGSEDLIEASAAARPSEGRTVISVAHDDEVGYEPTQLQDYAGHVAAHDAGHAADREGPTLARPSPRDEPAAPSLRANGPFGAPSDADPSADQGTLIMEGNPSLRERQLADAASFGPVSVGGIPNTAPKPFGQQGYGHDPSASHGDLRDEAQAARTGKSAALAAAPPPTNRVLVFVGVAVVTMVVVIVTGLVVLAFSD